MSKWPAIFLSAAYLAVLACTSGWAAQGPDEYEIAIPALPPELALEQFRVQTGLQIFYYHDPGLTALANPVHGRHRVESALLALFANTGYTHVRIDDRTFVVKPESPGDDAATDSGELDSARLDATTLEEVVVLGPHVTVIASRLADVAATAAPVAILNREEIDALGAATLTDLLKYIAEQPHVFSESARADGARYPELRGLGIAATLVLINGRRTLPTVDLSTIPVAAIERVEVFSEPNSAAFGPSAMGGVINIILKTNIPDPTLELRYRAADGGASERGVSLSMGHASDFLRGTLLLDFLDRTSLLGAQRGLWSDQDYRRFGGSDFRSTTSRPGNVISLDGSNLPGLSSSFAAIPAGSSGALTQADFMPTAGQLNRDSLYRFRTVNPAQTRLAALATVKAHLPNFDAFGEVLLVDRDIISQFGPPTLFRELVPAANPFNPFGVPVKVDLLLSELPSQQIVTETAQSRAVVGLRNREAPWNWELSLVQSVEATSVSSRNGLDRRRAQQGLAATEPTQALNVFQDGPVGSPALLASLVVQRWDENHFSKETQLAASLQGPLLKIRTDTVRTMFGGEWRREERSLPGASTTELHRQVSAAFMEVDLPLAGSAAHLSVGGRLDHFSDFGAIFRPQYGFTWGPTESLTVHASYGTSVSPPSVHELWEPRLLFQGALADPRRSHEVTNVPVMTGGNPGLKLTTSRSQTASFSLKPASIPGLEVFAKYWRIQLRDRIIAPHILLMLDNEAAFSERILRAPATEEEIAAGRAGALLMVDVSRINGGDIETSGVDLNISQQFDTRFGRLNSRLSLSWVNEFQAAEAPGMRATDRVGMASLSGTIPRWRVLGSLEWRRSFARFSVRARYVPEYDDASVLGRNGRVVGEQTLLDLNASVDLDEIVGGAGLWSGTTVAFGVENVFDVPPRFAAIGYAAGHDLSQDNLRQRFCHVTLSKRF